MSYLKLIKLLYIVDREALLRWGRPVTTDRHVSMPKGPVVSQIYDLIVGGNPPGTQTYWHDLDLPPRTSRFRSTAILGMMNCLRQKNLLLAKSSPSMGERAAGIS
jgi:hypothetical protein